MHVCHAVVCTLRKAYDLRGAICFAKLGYLLAERQRVRSYVLPTLAFQV